MTQHRTTQAQDKGGAPRTPGNWLDSAQMAGCSQLFSEDLNAGESMAGVSIVNPFGV